MKWRVAMWLGLSLSTPSLMQAVEPVTSSDRPSAVVQFDSASSRSRGLTIHLGAPGPDLFERTFPHRHEFRFRSCGDSGCFTLTPYNKALVVYPVEERIWESATRFAGPRACRSGDDLLSTFERFDGCQPFDLKDQSRNGWLREPPRNTGEVREPSREKKPAAAESERPRPKSIVELRAARH